MIGGIISAVANGLKVFAMALGWMKQQSDQNIGRQLQASSDAQETVKEATNAQVIDSSVAALSGSDLDRQLRDSTQTGS